MLLQVTFAKPASVCKILDYVFNDPLLSHSTLNLATKAGISQVCTAGWDPCVICWSSNGQGRDYRKGKWVR